MAQAFSTWICANLARYEDNEGGDGQAAREIFRHLGQAGWLEHALPQAGDSTRGIDLRTVCLLREICGYSSVIADVAFSEPWLGIMPIALYGSARLRDELLPRYLSGAMLPAFALSEPGAGSDAASITTAARREGDHYVINGRKTWTSNAGLADIYVVFAREAESQNSISAFAVDGRDSGIVFEERRSVLSPHTVGTWRLEDCRVPASNRLGAPGDGFKIAMRVLEIFRPSVGAAALGMARRAMTEAVERSRRRMTFGKALSEHQLTQMKLADMAVKVDAAALLVYRAAWQHDEGEGLNPKAAAIAKLHATEAAHEIADEAVQIFGGLGVVRGTAVERLFRHSRPFRIFDGASEIQKLIIAKSVLKETTR